MLNEEEQKEFNEILRYYIGRIEEYYGADWEKYITPFMLRFIDIEHLRKIYNSPPED